MNRMDLNRGVRCLLACIVTSVVPPTVVFAQDLHPEGAPDPSRFRATLASRLGAAPSEVLVGDAEGPVRLHDAELELFVASGMLVDGRKAVVAIDRDGNVVDLDAALAQDRELAGARRGKLGRRLHEEVLRRDPTERVLVVAWLDAPELGDLRQEHAGRLETRRAAGTLTHDAAESLQVEHSGRVRDRLAPVTDAAASAFEAAGLEVVGRDVFAPIVFLRANADDMARVMDDPRVLSLDFAGAEYVDRLNVATNEVRASGAWYAFGGTTGAGAKVSIVESGAVCTSNPFLTVAATRTAGGVSSHTTGVASCVASTHSTHRGVAPGATIISANAADFLSQTSNVTSQMPGSVAAVSWSINNGAQIMNLSYGAGAPNSTVYSFDKYLDYVVRNSAKTIAIACGNSGSYAGDPGAGFNAIAVGNFNDMGSSAWSGETMAGSSSWRNPSTGVETPQVAAPGSGITMLSCNASITGYTASGTSFSSPITAGVAALVVSKQPSLGSWPEAVRAIIMATAWHNIEGVARLSSKDGAGGVDAKAAFAVAARGKGTGYQYGTLTSSSFDANGLVTAQTGFASAGQAIRACLSFDSTPSGGPTYSVDSLKADLDLYVYAPNGALVATSTSGIQPFEVVHFTAPQTGTYTVKVKRYSFSGSSEYYGTAFTTSSDQ